MKIHESHSKRDILNYLEKNRINISSLEKLNKRTLINKIENDEIDINVDYLTDKNQMKSLSVKDRNDIMMTCKEIISLCNNGFNIKKSLFKNEEHVKKNAEYIADYGDIPSVRRAIRILNQNSNFKIKCKISPDVQELLNKKKKIKEQSVPSFHIKYGSFKLEF